MSAAREIGTAEQPLPRALYVGARQHPAPGDGHDPRLGRAVLTALGSWLGLPKV